MFFIANTQGMHGGSFIYSCSYWYWTLVCLASLPATEPEDWVVDFIDT